MKKVRGPLAYFTNNEVDGKTSNRPPSDHIPVMVELMCRRAGLRVRTQKTQWNTLRLRANADHPYCARLETLVNEWMVWAREVCEAHLTFGAKMGTETVSSLYQGLLLMMRSAAYQTLGKRRVPERQGSSYRATDPLTRRSTVEMWKTVRQRLVRKGRDERPPVEDLERELRAQADREPSSNHRKTIKWVRAQNSELDREDIKESSFDTLMEEATELAPIAVHLRDKTRWNVGGGMDEIPADMVKRAPKVFFLALALVVVIGKHAGKFPLRLVLALAKWVPKALNKWRGIRMGSLVAKPFEQLVTHPIFPVVGDSSKLIGSEHMAGKRGLSADMAATTLSCVVDEVLEEKIPAYFLFGDVKHAYDNVWREALWAKLRAKHPHLKDVKNVRALYNKFACMIKEGNYTSQLIEMKTGVPQGGPRSGDLFCFFMSDLSPAMASAGAGMIVYEYLVVCIIFLDDFVLPLDSPEHVRSTLTALWKYGEKWDVSWAVDKFRVLPYNVRNPQAAWRFGPVERVPTESTEKYLAVHFDISGSWKLHYSKKLTAANLTRREIRQAGLLGGANAPAASLQVVRAVVWPKVDYARPATNINGVGYAMLRRKLDAFTTSTLRWALGASPQSVIAGVIGESGEYTDQQRGDLATLLMVVRMINAPAGSPAYEIIRRCMRLPRKSIAKRAEDILVRMGLGRKMQVVWAQDAKSRIKAEMRKFAENEWKGEVRESARLQHTYSHITPLKLRGYLNESFRGRQLLMMLRMDDLPLAAASWLGRTGQSRSCWCGQGDETREHFLLSCPELQDIRDSHRANIPALESGRDPSIALRYVLLGSEPSAADNVERARLVGSYFADAWYARGRRSGRHQESYFP